MNGSNRLDRHILECFKRGCRVCRWDVTHVPEDCPYMICHALTVDRIGKIEVGGRRTGKTTRLVSDAMKLAREGYSVCVLCSNHDAARMMERSFAMPQGVKFMSFISAPNRLRNIRPSFVMFDEVGDLEMRKIMEMAQRGGHVFGGAVRSSE